MFPQFPLSFQIKDYQLPPPSITDEQAAVEVELQCWLDHAKQLNPQSRTDFTHFIQKAAGNILLLLQEMARRGDPSIAIARQAELSIKHLNDSAVVFLYSKGCYEKKKENIASQIENFHIKLNQSTPDFKPFSPLSYEHTESSSPFSDILIDYSIDHIDGKFAHKFEQIKGKPAALMYEMISHTLHGTISENSTNPCRDRLISSAVHIGITEALHKVLPSIEGIFSIVHATAKSAHVLESTVNQLAQNKEVAYWWDRQWILTGGEGPCFHSTVKLAQMELKLTQIPSQLLHAVHHKMTDIAATFCDTLGLTEEKIAYAARRSLEFLAENNSELLEQKMWESLTIEKHQQP
jgi:hypothetical protein